MSFPQGYGLVIGVGSYSEEPRLNVPTTAAEARALATVLRDPQRCGYPAQQLTVLCEHEATRERILAALSDLAARTTEDDTVLLFYSGHGSYLSGGGYCLTTHDTRFGTGRAIVPTTALTQQELLTALRALRPRRVLLLCNSCHAGELSPTLGDGEPFTGASLPETASGALLATGEGRVIITACREHQYAYIGAGPLTIFGQALIDGLCGAAAGGASDTIGVYELYTYLYKAVLTANRAGHWSQEDGPPVQEPELTVLKGIGPFPVAHTARQAGHTAPTLGPEAPRRELEPAECEAMLRRITGDVMVTSAERIGRIVQDKRSGYTMTIKVGQNSGVVVGENSGEVTQHVVQPSSLAEPIDPLAELIADLRAHAQRADDPDLAADLEATMLSLRAAHKAQDEGKHARRLEKLRAARQMLDPYCSHDQSLAAFATRIAAME